jgi:hypothetical protein
VCCGETFAVDFRFSFEASVSETEAWLQLADLASGKTYSPVVPMTPRSERPRSRELVAARRAKQLEHTQAHSATLLVALLASGCTRRPPNRKRARTHRTGAWVGAGVGKGAGFSAVEQRLLPPKRPKRRARLRWPPGSAASAPPRPGPGGGAHAAFLLSEETVEPLSL